jgi:hypothetical protein
MRYLTFVFLLPFLVLSQLFAQSSVWKISDGLHTMYLGGTIHVLRSSDFPLPHEFDDAYSKSDYVVFETDLSPSQSQELQKLLMRKMFLPSGQTLAQKLSPKTYTALILYLNSQGYNPAMFDRLEPWAVMMTLTQQKLSSIGIDQGGVDSYYSKRALLDKMPQKYLESIQEQSAIITEIGEGEEDMMILQTLEDMNELNTIMTWMVQDWREGKTERLERELVAEMMQESPKMYHRILVQRNNEWMPKLINMMREEKRGFVLVGAMHLLGNDGLLEQFRKAGYSVERE